MVKMAKGAQVVKAERAGLQHQHLPMLSAMQIAQNQAKEAKAGEQELQ